MTTTQRQQPQNNCPRKLREVNAFLTWNYEQHDGEPKPRKVPYYVNGSKRNGTQGSERDRAQLATFEDAVAASIKRGHAGVGVALLPGLGIAAGDFDHCVVDGVIDPAVERLVSDTYAELSPSGTGVRAFWLGDLGDNKDAHPADGSFGMETFTNKGFVTVTGQALPHVGVCTDADDIAPVSPELLALCAKRFNKPVSTTQSQGQAANADFLDLYEPRHVLTLEQINQGLSVLNPSMDRKPWLEIGMALHYDSQGSEEAFTAWHEWSASSADVGTDGKPKYSGERDCRERWESFGRHTGKPITARTFIKTANSAGASLRDAPVSEAEFEPLPDESPSTPAPKDTLRLLSATEMVQRKPNTWLVKKLVPQATLLVMYGLPGSGKSFVALDLAIHMALGKDWCGMRIKRRIKTIYVIAEGAGGFGQRIEAWCQHHQVPASELDEYIRFVDAAPNLLEKTDVAKVIATGRAWGQVDQVIFDTFAQSTPGANENSSEDMGRALSHVRTISRALSALAWLVAHAGKDSTKGVRGWSGIKGAADTELEISKDPETDIHRILLSKQKDGVDNLAFYFRLTPVELGVDEDLDVIESRVCTPCAPPVPQEKVRVLGPVEQVVYDVLSTIAQSQSSGIEAQAVIEEAAARMPAPEKGKRDSRKQRARRALDRLCEGDAPYFEMDDNGCLSVFGFSNLD